MGITVSASCICCMKGINKRYSFSMMMLHNKHWEGQRSSAGVLKHTSNCVYILPNFTTFLSIICLPQGRLFRLLKQSNSYWTVVTWLPLSSPKHIILHDKSNIAGSEGLQSRWWNRRSSPSSTNTSKIHLHVKQF